ncbi:MAG: hypothetical protein FDX30_11780 [Chlorobium sp.]|nr:MAG: hypothetical protein FDX30_11780 [Chlorobium sp.]
MKEGSVNWKKVLTAWLLIVAAESVHGTLRRLFLVPLMGDMPSRQAGVLVGSLIIFVIALLTVRGFGMITSRQKFLAGALWVLLTVIFEVSLGLLAGYTTERILSDYDLRQGGLMIFGLLFMFFTPFLAAKIRRAAE